jgi:hypothetical protein
METSEGEEIIKFIKKLIKKFIRPFFPLYGFDFPLNRIGFINSKKKFIFNNVLLFGNSRFIVLDNQPYFISNNFSQPKFIEKFLTDEESNCIIDIKNNTVSLLYFKVHSQKIEGNSISLMHPCCNNIYHFLLEACFDLFEAHRLNISFDNLIIDRELNSKYYSFLNEIIQAIYPKKKINIIKVSKYEKIEVSSFVSFSNKNSQIHWLRNHKTKPMHYWNKMWLIHVQAIFSNLYKKCSKKNKILFLIRKSMVRNTINERLIIYLLKKKYIIQICDPAKKSFRKVFYYINSCSMVVGQTSASFANILFAKQKKTIIAWKYNGPEQNKSLMKEFFLILGHTFIELDALPVRIKEPGLDWQAYHITQSNLYIPPEKVLCAIDEKK